MLHTSTVEQHTLDILKELMNIPELNHFFLVGGTCLSLRFGHRKSVDLDLFATNDFDNESLVQILENNFKGLSYSSTKNKIGFFCFIDNIKIDFVKHHHFNTIEEPIVEEGIRMFGDKDILAMKVFAILQRAQKKDFWDIAELLKHYSIVDLIKSYQQKYPSNRMLISIPHAIIYFDEAEESEDPVSLKNQTWPEVKKFIRKKVNEYLM